MFEPEATELQAVIFATDLASEILNLKEIVNDDTLGVEIEPLKIYCQKTGHIIGARDENSLFSLIKFKGKDGIVPALYNAVSLSVHPAWVETNGPALDLLIDNDPIGYACYCFGIITAQFYQNPKNIDRKRQPWIERYWAMARANALLTQRGIGELTELNIELCRLITFAPDSTSIFHKRARKLGQTPDMLAMLASTGELTPLLKACTNRTLDEIGSSERYVKATRFVDYAMTPADAARGPSNVRQQRASKRSVAEASVFSELAKLFEEKVPAFRFNLESNTPGTTAFFNKTKSANAAKEAELEREMLDEYAKFGGTNFDFSDDAEDDDNEVETRQLIRDPSEVAAQQDNASTQIEIIETTSGELFAIKTENNIQENEVEARDNVPAQIAEYKRDDDMDKLHDDNLSRWPNGMLKEIPMTVGTPQKPMSPLERLRAMQAKRGN